MNVDVVPNNINNKTDALVTLGRMLVTVCLNGTQHPYDFARLVFPI